MGRARSYLLLLPIAVSCCVAVRDVGRHGGSESNSSTNATRSRAWRLAQHEPLGPDRGGRPDGGSNVSPAGSHRTLQHPALRRSCRLVPDQHGVSSPTTTAFQVRAGSFTASHPLVNRGQNVAIGLTGLPDVPAKRTGATASWKSHWPSSAAVLAHTSRSQLSSIHRPIATRLTA